MTPSIVFVVPGVLEARSGGYEYDRQMIRGLQQRGWIVDVREISSTFPRPTPEGLGEADRVFASIPDRTTIVVDGLAYGAMPDVVLRHAGRVRFVPLVHLPLALDVGLDATTIEQFRSAERRAVHGASFVVVTGATTADVLTADYGVARERIAVIEPGTAPARAARGSGAGDAVHLLCVAAVTRGKGHDLLVRALSRVAARNWRLTCAGTVDRDRAHVTAVRNLIAAARLTDRVTLAGEVDEPRLDALYDSSDVFVLATYRETYGMAVAEALARGLPVVSTRTGAIPSLVGDRAGVVVNAGDLDALAAALRRVIEDAAWRSELANGARAASRALRTWREAVDQFASVLACVAADERIAR